MVAADAGGGGPDDGGGDDEAPCAMLSRVSVSVTIAAAAWPGRRSSAGHGREGDKDDVVGGGSDVVDDAGAGGDGPADGDDDGEAPGAMLSRVLISETIVAAAWPETSSFAGDGLGVEDGFVASSEFCRRAEIERVGRVGHADREGDEERVDAPAWMAFSVVVCRSVGWPRDDDDDDDGELVGRRHVATPPSPRPCASGAWRDLKPWSEECRRRRA